MFTKVLIVCALSAVALALEYPPGVHPALCPNYPYCDMELLARYTPQATPTWQMYPYAGVPYARARIVYAPYPIIAKAAVARTEAPAEAPAEPARYPADFDPSLCPNYPYCT